GGGGAVAAVRDLIRRSRPAIQLGHRRRGGGAGGGEGQVSPGAAGGSRVWRETRRRVSHRAEKTGDAAGGGPGRDRRSAGEFGWPGGDAVPGDGLRARGDGGFAGRFEAAGGAGGDEGVARQPGGRGVDPATGGFCQGDGGDRRQSAGAVGGAVASSLRAEQGGDRIGGP